MTTRATTPTTPGVYWRGRHWRIAGGAVDTRRDPASERIDRQLRENFPSEARDIDLALERGQARLQKDLKALTRPDGTAVYMPAEQQERAVAIRSAATAEFDLVGDRIKNVAQEAIEKARADLAKLEGDEGWGRLTAEQQQKAATRREFVKEDAELLPPHELVKRLRGALAAADQAEMWLYDRYVGIRIDREQGRAGAELLALHREITARSRDQKAAKKRQALEQRLSSAQVLGGLVERHRMHVDGRHEQMLAGMRARMRF